MSRPIGASLVASLALFLVAGVASAQYGVPGYVNRPNVGVGAQPQLPPYLNLNRNNDPAVQLFLRAIPEQQRRANTQTFGSILSDLELRSLTSSAPTTAEADLFQPLPTTGHPAVFQNTAGYFPRVLGRPATGAAYQPPKAPTR